MLGDQFRSRHIRFETLRTTELQYEHDPGNLIKAEQLDASASHLLL